MAYAPRRTPLHVAYYYTILVCKNHEVSESFSPRNRNQHNQPRCEKKRHESGYNDKQRPDVYGFEAQYTAPVWGTRSNMLWPFRAKNLQRLVWMGLVGGRRTIG